VIVNSKQLWQVGEAVKVGFLRLRVVACVATPGDYKPDRYLLCGLGAAANRRYQFTPHYGLTRIDHGNG
jgi:hypothetical protein